MEEKEIQEVKSLIEEIMAYMGFSGEITPKLNENTLELTFDIKISDGSNFLIGQHGINLQALQHIARLAAKKKTGNIINFTLDVNSYRKEKNSSILDQALFAAQQAIDQKRSIIMKPMSAYERRIVHMELAKNDAVKTESIGEGEDRKIIVKPASEI